MLPQQVVIMRLDKIQYGRQVVGRVVVIFAWPGCMLTCIQATHHSKTHTAI